MSASTDTVVDEFTLEVHARPAPARPRSEEFAMAAVADEADEPLPGVEFAVVPDVDWDAAPHGEPDAALDQSDPTR
jgi:hypothetical protein